MQADPSGQLHAKFAMIQQELVMKAHFGDVPDMSQQAKEGITLDLYAQLMARAGSGADMMAVIQEAGIGWDQWQRAQAAWNAAMASDTNHHITTQYGQLYAKHTPGFQERMQGQIAAAMAADHARRAAGTPDEPQKEYTFDDMVRELSDSTPNTRWTAAHHIANSWDRGNKSDEVLDRAARKAVELAKECLERHDEFTVSNAETLARDLAMFASEGLFTVEEAGDAKSSILRCLNRAKEKLATLEAAFVPIRNKAVPERIHMQSQIQDYTSLVGELSSFAGSWDSSFRPPEPSVPPPPPVMSSPPVAITAPEPRGGILWLLRRLPIIGPLLRMLGL